jgi:glycogen operon protein
VLQRTKFFRGKQLWESELKDLTWLRADGREMKQEDWQTPTLRSLALLLGGDAIPLNEQGHRPVGDTLLVLLNAEGAEVTFTLPELVGGISWEVLLDTAQAPVPKHGSARARGALKVMAKAVVVLSLDTQGQLSLG